LSLFISFEGGEGSGKSTQAGALHQALQQAGVSSLLVHEPGTTPLGAFLRDKLKQEIEREHALSPSAELFLFAAARAELVANVLKPALDERDAVVIADRYADSTTAYQGYGRLLPLEDIVTINRIATQGLVPDVTFLLDCSPEQGLGRIGSVPLPDSSDTTPGSRIDQEGTQRFEKEPLDFHQRVRAGYLRIAENEPGRWHVIDATMAVQEISDAVWKRVEARVAGLTLCLEIEGPVVEQADA
jgi:dTMP kinase